MTHEEQIHPIQRQILRSLLFYPERKFSELAPGVSSDQLSFHIKRLVELSLIQKSGEGYALTTAGKEYANRFDTDPARMAIERQPKIGVLVICVAKDGGETRYLVQQRLKQPYYGFYGFMTGKVRWGETIEETAARELEEETGLHAKLTHVAIKHKMDYASDGTLLEDKFFFAFRGEDTSGTILGEFEGGRNIWLTKKEIMKLPNLFDGVSESLAFVHNDTLQFLERKYTVEKY
ncbi:MAG: NUDIX domain-containing protein [Patescibacteria group bacterium]